MLLQKSLGHKVSMFYTILLLIGSLSTAFSQSSQQISVIKSSSDLSKLELLKSDFQKEFSRKKTLLVGKAITKTSILKEVLPNGKTMELVDVDENGTSLYYETYSDEASQVSRANFLKNDEFLNLNLDGQGMQIGVWDAGVALDTHVEYGNRAIVGDGSLEISSHATLVTGSLISSGLKREAKGVAHAATVTTNDWSKDKIEVLEAVANGMLLSNHSYGIMANRVPDWYFGAYTKVAQDWDKIMYAAPYYLMVTAAGNAQKSNHNDSPIFGKVTDSFDVLLGFTLTKNGITVAGANTVIDSDGNLKKAEVSGYSSFGPVDDGRIKPDLAGDGSSILSTDSYSIEGYNTSAGTSMATPGITGSLLLLQQYNEQLTGAYLKAATLKGLALHTADDVADKGPDYKMGWGVMNTKKAADVLASKDFTSYISESRLLDQESVSITVTALENENLIASISWTDPENNFVNIGDINNTTAALVNDLDIRISQNGKTILPWKLNPAYADRAATQGDNKVDPFERIDINNASGEYTITITHKGQLKNGFQDFSLIISGVQMNQCNLEAPENLLLTNVDGSSLTLEWDNILDALYEIQYKFSNTDQWITEYATVNNIKMQNLIENERYDIQLRTFCSENSASTYSDIASFTFTGANTVLDSIDSNETFDKDTDLKFSIYPNPAVNEIQLHTKFSESAIYHVVSTMGVEVSNGKANDAVIDVSKLATGLYILQVQDNNEYRSVKFYKR